MRILGIDYGQKRLGLALSDEEGILASPLSSYSRRILDQDLDFLAALAKEKQVRQIVVGLPRNMNGSLGEMAKEAFAFEAALKEKIQIPTATFDERLTSSEAERLLIQADISRRRRRTLRDSLAAVLILQGYLETLKQSAKACP
jgi:putative Holliday junction resolvase